MRAIYHHERVSRWVKQQLDWAEGLGPALYEDVASYVPRIMPTLRMKRYDVEQNCDIYEIHLSSRGPSYWVPVPAGRYLRTKLRACDLLYGRPKRERALERQYLCETPRYSFAELAIGRLVALVTLATDADVMRVIHEMIPEEVCTQAAFRYQGYEAGARRHSGPEERVSILFRGEVRHVIYHHRAARTPRGDWTAADALGRSGYQMAIRGAAMDGVLRWQERSGEPDGCRVKGDFGLSAMAHWATHRYLFDHAPHGPRD